MSKEFRGRGIKLHNEYAALLGSLFTDCPKAVLAAIAISALCGDDLNAAHENVLKEWWALYDNGIVPQKPPVQIDVANHRTAG